MNNKFASQSLLESIKHYEPQFLQLIRERLGIIIRVHQTSELSKTLLDACNQFGLEAYDYLQQLKTCSNTSPLLEFLVTGITVGETYFFRDKRQMHLLKYNLLPKIIKKKQEQGHLSLRIWSAGCSSGEEIYTIAMLLVEMLPHPEIWSLNLLGTDINKVALEKCLVARYSQWSMRSITDYYKNKYFSAEKNLFTLSPKIQSLAKFSYLNLNENNYPAILNGTIAQDLILCRNVLIYFDDECVAHIMKKLTASLVEDGYLVLGASDPINVTDTKLKFCHEEGAIYFQRED